MTTWLKQSTAAEIALGPFVDSTDGVTAETALTIAQADIRLKKNGGAWAQTNNAAGATHEENGYYEVPLNTTDTDTLGLLRVAVNESGALPVWRDFMVVPANVWDSMFGSDKLQVDSVELNSAVLATDGPVPQLGIVDQGTAQSATGTTLVLRAASAFADDTLIGCLLGVHGSTQGYWQWRFITDSVLSTDTVTVDTFTVTPSGTITYRIFGSGPASTTVPVPANITQIAGSTVSASSGLINANVTQISGDSTAADNAELAFDGTGYNVGSGQVVAASVTGAVGSVTGAVGSVTGAVGSVTGLTASDVGAIKTKTDSLTFTQAGHVDANIQRINDVAVTGDGSGTPFGV